ncbi:MAG TPA: sigma 54-interacting transcriptional regulator [Bacillota bacterium]|nr:sigma 54-interacting transcriptional regulator [Bacillota bacterium]
MTNKSQENNSNQLSNYLYSDQLIMDLVDMFDSSYDVIYVSDAKGKTLRVTPLSEHLYGKKESELVGKNVYDLEEEGVYSTSVTRLVLETGEKISRIQTTASGIRLMVTGIPIKDNKGNIIRVINASRNVTQVSKIKSEMEEMRKIIEGYKEELKSLRKKETEQKTITNNAQMEKVIQLAKRVATVDSTILILGESGVGKEVITNFIHKNSSRAENAFLKINCGAIPENLLESELFGYEKGAFTGANNKGKAGLFELADNGTLFLDEIADMPLSLQVKLLRVLQEKEVMRIGGTRSISVDARIITATNTDLKKEVAKGRFREDLYYRLNVIPINIPPLRKRPEDILLLANHFIEYFNETHTTDRRFSPQILHAFQSYDWPGNVRELQNIVERLVVTSDERKISSDLLPEEFHKCSINEESVKVNKIIPLKKCLELAEKQLLSLAREKYSSTTEIAKVLEVNQSTISRKFNKYK